jgi:DNA-binding MarR family transcriptional regulator
MVLGQAGRLASRQLSGRMDITPGTVSQYVSRLSGRGLLEQTRDTQDRRAWWLTLTEAGQDVYQRAHAGSVRYTTDMLAMLDPDEQRVLHRLLLKASHGNGYEWQKH